MAKVINEINTEFDHGDTVIFKDKDDELRVGIIEGYVIDWGVWYNIRVSPDHSFTSYTEGDIAEGDILGLVSGDASLFNKINDAILRGE